MPTIQEIVKDPDFLSLPREEKLKVFQRVDADFVSLPGSEQNKVIDSFAISKPESVKTDYTKPFSVAAHSPVDDKDPKRAMSSFGRNVVPAVTSLGGVALGSFLGGPPGAKVMGGGGYALGLELADQIDKMLGKYEDKPAKEDIQNFKNNMALGMAMEIGGEVAASTMAGAYGLTKKAGKWILDKLPPLTKESAKKQAGRILAVNMNDGPVFIKNAEDAAELESLIPGLKFSMGERTADPGILKFERAMTNAPGETAGMVGNQRAQNTLAIKDFINKAKGSATPEDAIKTLETQKANTEAGVLYTGGRLSREAEKFTGQIPLQETGQIIKSEAAAGKRAAKGEASRLFNEVPEFEIDASRITSKINELSKPLSRVEDVSKNIPNVFNRAKGLLEETNNKLTPQDLQGIRQELGSELRNSQNSSNPNARLEKRISGLMGEIDDVLREAGEGTGSASEKLKTARTFFRQEVIEKFKEGPVGEILKTKFTGDAVSDSQVASRFFKPGREGAENAKKFVETFGNESTAKAALDDAINQNMLDAVTDKNTGEIVRSKLNGWLFKHKPALEQLGLSKKYDSLVTARSELDKALETKSMFDKSAASKMIGTDVNSAVKKAFEGSKKTQAAYQLMNKVKHDGNAVSGLQNSVIDDIISRSELSATDTLGNSVLSYDKLSKGIKEYDPALKILFKDAPEKIKALESVRTAVKIMQRSKTPIVSGGSDTAANILTIMGKASGMSNSRTLNIAKAFIKPLKDMGDEQVNIFLNRAMFDPDFANTLKLMTKEKTTVDQVERRLKGHMLSLGMKGFTNDNTAQ